MKQTAVKRQQKINSQNRASKAFSLPVVLILVLMLSFSIVAVFTLSGLGLQMLDIKAPALPSTSGVKVYDRYDRLVAVIYADRDLQPVALSAVSADFKHAIIAAEDHNYYHHDGVDLLGIFRAMLINLTAGRWLQGGSTISQQLIKNVYFEGKPRTPNLKFKEALMAVDLERRYSKERILESYINSVYFGSGVYGVQRAAEQYFGTSASKLSLAESAYLAGLINAPSELSTLSHRQEAIARQHQIIESMQELGYATPQQAQIAKDQPLVFNSKAANSTKYRHYTSPLLKICQEELGLESSEDLYQRGLQIYSNLDCLAQEEAERRLTEGIRSAPHGINQGALVSISVADGSIISMVGGAGRFDQNQWNRATSRHTAGSVFKPFVYLAGLSTGILNPDSWIEDAPLEINIPGAPTYRPRNFDGTYLGPITIRKALALSRNTCAIRVAQQVGPNTIIEYANKAGITSPLDSNLSLALGSSAVTPLEMADSFATLARNGERIKPSMIRKICDTQGNIIKTFEPSRQQALPSEPVAELVDALQDVVEHGTGTRAQLFARPVAGKTGTSDHSKDIWFVGFTPDLVTAVWGGNDDNKPVKGNPTGGSVMANIWQNYTQAYYRQHSIPITNFPAPAHPLMQEREPLPVIPAPASIFEIQPEEDYHGDVPYEPMVNKSQRGKFKKILQWLGF